LIHCLHKPYFALACLFISCSFFFLFYFLFSKFSSRATKVNGPFSFVFSWWITLSICVSSSLCLPL
jgi:hypothetical protein